MRHRIRAALSTTATATALIAALVATPPAHADRYAQDDPGGDMFRGGGGSGAESPAPGHSALDIRHVIVRHTDHFVSIRVIVETLTRPRGSETFFLDGFVKPNLRARPWESTAWTWEVEFDKTKPRVGDRIFIMDSTHQESISCDGWRTPGLQARANYDRDRITMLIPRRCLTEANALPRWVQVSVFASHVPRRRAYYFDQFNAPIPSSGSYYLQGSYFTPRLYAG